MLAQSFQSAADLGITEEQLSALQKTLVLLETGRLQHVKGKPIESFAQHPKYDGLFNMDLWQAEYPCGTVCCIGGTAAVVGSVSFGEWWGSKANLRLKQLFSPTCLYTQKWGDITPEQAARALRSYLTTGDAKWAEAVSA